MGIPSAVAVMRAARGDAAAPPPPGGEPDYLLYYRGTLDAAELRKLEFEGDVGETGMWRRLMNCGASLTVEGRRVEVIYRDLDAVEHWVGEASEGRFEIDAVDGWLAGMPTCVLAGELATCEALAGEVARPEFPAALRASATRRWRDIGRPRTRDRRVARVVGGRGRLRRPAGEGRDRRGPGSARRTRGVGAGRGPDRPASGPRLAESILARDRRPAARPRACGLPDAGGAGADRGRNGMILGAQVTS